jgi:hypothetical protein
MARAKRTRPAEPAEPDSLVRQAAGSYRSADGRFEVEQSGSTWFLLDKEQTNELGQELIHGPFSALKAVREAMPGARTVTPLPRSRRRPPPSERRKKPPPPSWIDKLPNNEAAAVRRLIRALEREGVEDAEALVRRDRDGNSPAVAARLIDRRLDALIEDVPDKERERAQELIRRAAEVLTNEGSTVRDPLPGWLLVEIGPEREPVNRRIRTRG